ncbi:MAG: hypothetical protein AB7G88_07055 [Thermomicrobiales bacterium]
MVKNPRAPARIDQLRPLNQPQPIRVEVEQNLPVALFGARQERQRIVDIHEVWCIDDEWWREPIHRRYYRIELENGSLRTIYSDANRWYEQKY